jgi:hypothetical protein
MLQIHPAAHSQPAKAGLAQGLGNGDELQQTPPRRWAIRHRQADSRNTDGIPVPWPVLPGTGVNPHTNRSIRAAAGTIDGFDDSDGLNQSGEHGPERSRGRPELGGFWVALDGSAGGVDTACPQETRFSDLETAGTAH